MHVQSYEKYKNDELHVFQANGKSATTASNAFNNVLVCLLLI